MAAAIVGDRDTALDVVQDAFGSAIRNRRTFRREGPLEGWIWRTVVNTARNHRSELRTKAPVAEAPSQNGHADGSSLLAAAIVALPERQRLALFLRYYADLDYRGIAEALGIRPGTVAATLNAARAALRSSLQEVSR